MWEIERSVPQLDNIEVTITAQVGDYYWNEIIEGYSKARVYNSSLKLQFLGGSPQVFKPSMPFTSYVCSDLVTHLKQPGLYFTSLFCIMFLDYHIISRWLSTNSISSAFEQFRGTTGSSNKRRW